MLVKKLYEQTSEQRLGKKLFALVEELFPICRSITGNGVRQTLMIINKLIDLEVIEVPSGTQVLDWSVPREWNIYDAYVKDIHGNRIVDFHQSNLHVLNYSIPFSGLLSLDELKEHIFTLPEQPNVIPYRTSYYKESWGFCLTQNQLDAMPDGEYEVCIDASLTKGALTYGELLIPGQSKQEVLISTHICHPSLANDNLSGISVAAFLAKFLSEQSLYYSYRVLFIPGTIGAITWLASHEDQVANIKHGLVLTGLGDSAGLTYKRSRQHNAEIDKVASYVLAQQASHQIFDFSPYGYDERQYCSPGFDLAVGRLSRSPFGTFAEYHTSNDNLSFVDAQQLEKSMKTCINIIDILENNRYYVNTQAKGEPQLSKYGLYSSIGGLQESRESQMAILWILNLADGTKSLLDIAIKSGILFEQLTQIAQVLLDKGLLNEAI
ncbi:DUF4910 domain-containing protein [Paraglaciecola sp. L3A3]|uniref:DUF4910 domain-containing protein n=1 Tax=Paraglaciecola sp. L3A3 TaxID=2686358 RepID=UPI00131D517C|nr:DUF4910 domain-containing protein [Paraglaciecola sp. L3A3]